MGGSAVSVLPRPFWLARLAAGWAHRPIVWLAGARRTGKTTLATQLPGAVVLNCDLPSVVRRAEDPELLFRSLPPGATVVFDEVHRLADPSGVLKVGADAFRSLRLLATGSSTLAATRTFRDALTGRKTLVHLSPVLWSECLDGFGGPDLDRRLQRGGLPELLLADLVEPAWYAEWLDSFYARDIQALFGIRQRTGFLRLLHLVLRQSGGMADYTALSQECDLSRPTVKAHLEAMRVACALTAVPPFHGGSRREIVKRPRIYGFDTGFVCFVRGWDRIREDDRGGLWEHLVLDELRTAVEPARTVSFWRDKSGREIDFVVARGREADAFECKIRPDRVERRNLDAFRDAYPRGRNFVVSPFVERAYDFRIGAHVVRAVGCADIRSFGGRS